jgi:uncharacterized protein
VILFCDTSALIKLYVAEAYLELTQSVAELAASYADLFALRGFDSIQLASAKELQMKATDPVHFACCDQRLVQASAVLGM